jgi:hypothetical protein
MNDIHYHPVFRPFINFLVALVIPAACIYLFAFKSFDTIKGLKAENSLLRASVDERAPQTNTVILHDTTYINISNTDTIKQVVFDTIYRPIVKTDTVTVYRPDKYCEARIKSLRDSLEMTFRIYRELVDRRENLKAAFERQYNPIMSRLKEMRNDSNCCNKFGIAYKFLDYTRDMISKY